MVDDLEAVLSQRFIIYVALLCFSLFAADHSVIQQTSSFLTTATQILGAVAQLVTFTRPDLHHTNHLSFFAWLSFIPSLLLGVFGIISLILERPVSLLGHDAHGDESDGFLNVGVILFHGIVLVKVFSALFNFDNYIATLSASAVAGFQAPFARELAKFVLIHYVFQSMFFLFLWRISHRSQRTILAGIVLLSLILSLEFGAVQNVLRDSDALRIFLLVSVAFGVRFNVGTSGPSLSLSPRNVLWLMLLIDLVVSLSTGGQQVSSGVHTFIVPAKISSFLEANSQVWYLQGWHLQLVLMFANWIIFVNGDEHVVRVALLARLVLLSFVHAFLIPSAERIGMNLSAWYPSVAIDVFSVVLILKSLSDSLHGTSFFAFLRSIFAWSYSPIKGGKEQQSIQKCFVLSNSLLKQGPYYICLQYIVSAISLFFFHFSHAHLFASEQSIANRQLLAIMYLGVSFSLYVIVRTADRQLSQLISFLLLFSHIAQFIIATRLMLSAGVLVISWITIAHYASGVIAILASIHHDYNHGHSQARDVVSAPKSPRAKSPRAKSPRAKSPRGGRRNAE